jgi:hypothetical protein
MSFSFKIVDGGQSQWPIFEHVVFQEWKNKRQVVGTVGSKKKRTSKL